MMGNSKKLTVTLALVSVATAAVVATGCATSRYHTAETLAPGQTEVYLGAEVPVPFEDGAVPIPLAGLRTGVSDGMDIGLRAGYPYLQGDAKVRLAHADGFSLALNPAVTMIVVDDDGEMSFVTGDLGVLATLRASPAFAITAYGGLLAPLVEDAEAATYVGVGLELGNEQIALRPTVMLVRFPDGGDPESFVIGGLSLAFRGGGDGAGGGSL